MDLSVLSLRLHALSVLRRLQTHPLLNAYMDTLDALSVSATRFADCYGVLCEMQFAYGDVSSAMLDAIHCDTNALTDALSLSSAAPGCVTHAASHLALQPALLETATFDLATLNALLKLTGSALKDEADAAFHQHAFHSLPDFPAAAPLPFGTGEELVQYYRTNGYGFFSQAAAFSVEPDGTLLPIRQPDPIRLSDLHGYTRQKQQILQNTQAFLRGRDANNILLYGDKGTGKSSTIKAVANEYADRGLKIIGMSPRQIAHFPKVFAQARRSPFRFLVYLDDLSFRQEDESFAALKAFIEGGLAEKPMNVVIYATSNRRHLIRESMAERQGDDVRVRDTLETVTSLSDRFGLEITFSVPDKDEYLFIVDQLAAEQGIPLLPDELHLLAERFALRRNGRSPRTAQQFIRQYLAEQDAAHSHHL